MSEKEYVTEEFAKLKTVIQAARQNKSTQQGIRITTVGADPSATTYIEAYVLEKFLKSPQ